MAGEKQIFVKVENYNDTIDVIELIRSKLKDGRSNLTKIKQLKAEEDSLIARWNAELDEMEKRFSYITDSFSEGNN